MINIDYSNDIINKHKKVNILIINNLPKKEIQLDTYSKFWGGKIKSCDMIFKNLETNLENVLEKTRDFKKLDKISMIIKKRKQNARNICIN